MYATDAKGRRQFWDKNSGEIKVKEAMALRIGCYHHFVGLPWILHYDRKST